MRHCKHKCRMKGLIKTGHPEDSLRSDGIAYPSSASTEWREEDGSDGLTEISDASDGRKGSWTAEEDRELSSLIEVQPHNTRSQKWVSISIPYSYSIVQVCCTCISRWWSLIRANPKANLLKDMMSYRDWAMRIGLRQIFCLPCQIYWLTSGYIFHASC